MPVDQVEAHGLLFDMDGVSDQRRYDANNSTAALSAVWVEFCDQYDMDLNDLVRILDGLLTMQLQNSHGKRTVENLKERLPHLSHEKANEEAVRFEERIIEISDENRSTADEQPTSENPQGTIVGLPGVKELLTQINEGANQGSRHHGWAIVTSATGDYARRAFLSTGVSDAPKVFISSDDVTAGKPHPQPYETGAKVSDFDIKNTIVVEDAPAGVLSGKRAGARVLALETTHNARRLWENGADWVVKDLSQVSAKWKGDNLQLTIDSMEKPSDL
ncbi:hypothetical protein MYAM1_003863 [Malassezia yamatoensis]|uniref:Uncharacterized protein n=1 Tax=Malassezia yamatoensis TaxID=253288 RepID=A0AAJ5YWP6_9BASI|nr:hypothetical protein MYAM1_003863 [Malassezia yamatoensis]